MDPERKGKICVQDLSRTPPPLENVLCPLSISLQSMLLIPYVWKALIDLEIKYAPWCCKYMGGRSVARILVRLSVPVDCSK